MGVAPAGGLPDAEIRDLAIAPSTPTTLRAASSDAATFTVTNTADSGPGSLREAILNSNASAGVLDTIAFNVGAGCSGSPAICTIAPATALPAITDPVILDATTQPGYSGSPLIQISTGGLSDGLLVTAGGTTIRGLSIVGFNYGIRLTTNGGNTIQASRLGLRPDGLPEPALVPPMTSAVRATQSAMSPPSFRFPTAGSYPEGIAAGADGNLWFTESSGNRIGSIYQWPLAHRLRQTSV